jgi:catechol 2,3-dioxygenase-like lactoylglutathione lyase family enzyme
MNESGRRPRRALTVAGAGGRRPDSFITLVERGVDPDGTRRARHPRMSRRARQTAAMQLSQVNLFVTDFATMLSFYREVLGFKTTDIDPGEPCVPLVNWASLQTGGLTIELFDAQTFWDATLLRSANRDAVQLCFLVGDVERERARLEASGVSCDPIVAESWGSYASFRDPQGNWLQIYSLRGRST